MPATAAYTPEQWVNMTPEARATNVASWTPEQAQAQWGTMSPSQNAAVTAQNQQWYQSLAASNPQSAAGQTASSLVANPGLLTSGGTPGAIGYDQRLLALNQQPGSASTAVTQQQQTTTSGGGGGAGGAALAAQNQGQLNTGAQQAAGAVPGAVSAARGLLQNSPGWLANPGNALPPVPAYQSVNDLVQQYSSSTNPLMRQAAAQALMQMNSRGLLNTSMALQAGQAAALQTVMPAAQQESATQAALAQSQLAYEQNLAQNAQQYGLNLGTMGVQYSQNAALQAAGAAQQAAQQQIGIGGALQTQAQQGEIASQLSSQSYQQQLGLNQQQYGFQTALANLGFTQQQQINQQQFGFQTALASQQNQFQQGLMTLDSQIRSGLAAQGHGYDVELANINTANQQLIYRNQDASYLYLTGLQQIGSILGNSDLSAEQQQAGVNSVLGNMSAGLSFIGQISSSGLPPIPDYGSVFSNVQNVANQAAGGGGGGGPAGYTFDPSTGTYQPTQQTFANQMAGYIQGRGGTLGGTLGPPVGAGNA